MKLGVSMDHPHDGISHVFRDIVPDINFQQDCHSAELPVFTMITGTAGPAGCCKRGRGP